MRQIKYAAGENPNPGPCVAVVCDDRSHPKKLVQVALFFKRPDSPWAVFPARSVKGGMRWAMQMLDGNRLLSPEEQRALDEGEPMPRVRFDLRCDLCGDSLPITLEKAAPILDTLAEHADAWELELTRLRARLLK